MELLTPRFWNPCRETVAMFRSRRLLSAIVALALLVPALATAQEPKSPAGDSPRSTSGTADFNRAMELNAAVENLGDLTEVIRLFRSALKQGLAEENESVAKTTLAGALSSRADAIAAKVFGGQATPRQFAELRKTALDDLEESVRLLPNQPDALLNIARFQALPGGDAKRALEVLNDALKQVEAKSPKRVRYLLLRAKVNSDEKLQLADLDEALSLAGKTDKEAVIRARAMHHMQRGNFKAALPDLDQAIELNPKLPGTYEARGVARYNLGDQNGAMQDFERVKAMAVDSPVTDTYRVRIMFQNGQLRPALREVDKLLRRNPNAAALLLLRAELRRVKGDRTNALEDVEQVLKQRPGAVEALQMHALLAAELKQMDTVQKDLEEIKRQVKDEGQYLMLAGTLYTVAKHPDLASQAFSQAIAKDATNWQALRGRGDSLLAQGKQLEAIQDYETGLKIKPDDSAMLNNLAWVLSTSPDDKVRDGKRALEVAKKACEVTDYKMGHIVSTLAAAHAETGDFAEALKIAEQAAKLATLPDLKRQVNAEIEHYKAKKPFREAKPADVEPPTIDETDDTSPKDDAAPKGDQPADAPADKPKADKPKSDDGKPAPPKSDDKPQSDEGLFDDLTPPKSK